MSDLWPPRRYEDEEYFGITLGVYSPDNNWGANQSTVGGVIAGGDYDLDDIQAMMDKMQRALGEPPNPEPIDEYVLVPIWQGQAIPTSVTGLEVECWQRGTNMPSILERFDRWWVAMLFKKRLITECYRVEIGKYKAALREADYLSTGTPWREHA